jgi:outer membrane protein assembly factor BamE (lipoprotein component of BamABCDE complex)
MGRILLNLAFILVVGLLSACAQYENRRGVEVSWQSYVTDNLVRGQTTRQDLLEQLGPPSQVISLEDETVLYYLFERSEGSGLILIVYNRFKVDTRYDRAIFFFDANDLLSDYATRISDEKS